MHSVSRRHWIPVLALSGCFAAACDGQAAKRDVTADGAGGAGGDTAGGGGASAPAVIPNDGPCALALNEVALYQAVKIPLAVPDPNTSLSAATERNADVVVGRPAMIRAFATPTDQWQGIATARLTLISSKGTKTIDATNDLRRPSNDLQFDSTFNFDVPAGAIDEDTAWRVDVVSPASCANVAIARFPNTGGIGLGARTTGVVKVMLVPVQYDTDASGRLPDITATQIERFRALVMSMYPATAVEIAVREPVSTKLGVKASDGWEDLLDALRLVRQQDRAAADVHYYGVVNPASTFNTYCGRACTAGIAYVTRDQQPSLRVGVGVGFTGQFAAQTFAHELGHQHGRLHSPCNVDGDTNYPYAKGGIGSWGFDASSSRVIDPAAFSDIMGYCSPTWVSDFTYQGLLEHLALLRSQPSVQALKTERTWRVLIVNGEGQSKWGHPLTTADEPSGDVQTAQVFDGDGTLVAEPAVYRISIGDSGTAMVWVPEPERDWVRVVVPGASPLRFDEPVATPKLLPL
ncbi:MAG: M66 family metalloprotease [Deltaproteobacteria bacterium]|nr:M66 family metalloprotease [Deltaproteobacteria bacterium]